jgi:hypothetical protein
LFFVHLFGQSLRSPGTVDDSKIAARFGEGVVKMAAPSTLELV